MKPITLKARDGVIIHGYLILPVGIRSKNLPMVLNVHGGRWNRDFLGFNPEAQFFANRGYAFLQVNFRGSSGYGKKFLNAGNKEWGGKMHHDLIDLVNWAIKEGLADPNRIVIYGYPPYWEPFKKLLNEKVGNLETEKEFLKSQSPLFKVHNIKIPLLIAHGANNPRVKKFESKQIVNALKSQNIPYEYLLFPDERHGLVNPENRLKFYAKVEEFLSKYL
ncbi:MAG: alpha/beta hydrolase family protein [Candidatus Ratteibacteria bacterium]